jgi:hypothetical protein
MGKPYSDDLRERVVAAIEDAPPRASSMREQAGGKSVRVLLAAMPERDLPRRATCCRSLSQPASLSQPPSLWNDGGVSARRAGRWDDWHDTAPGRGYRNARIDFGRGTDYALGARQLIAQIGAAVSFSWPRHDQTSGSCLAIPRFIEVSVEIP